MRTYISIILILVVVFFANCVVAQKQYLEKNKTYSTAKIFLKSKNEILKVSNLILINDTVLQYQESNTGSRKQLKIIPGNVKYISAKSGTHAGTFALYGGLLGLSSALYGVLSAENESMQYYGETSDVNWGPFIAGFTVGGAAIGGLIGAFSPKYKNFYIKNNTTAYKFGISPRYFNNGGFGLAVNVKF